MNLKWDNDNNDKFVLGEKEKLHWNKLSMNDAMAGMLVGVEIH